MGFLAFFVALAAVGVLAGGIGGGRMVRDGVRILSLPDGRILGRPLDWTPGGLQYSADGRYVITGNEGAHGNVVDIIDASFLKVVDSVRTGGSIFDLTTNPGGGEFAVASGKSIVVSSLPKTP